MKAPLPTERVRAWEETVTIQTYPSPAPDRNPMFLDKRVYQGSSGKVYPNPFTDHISDIKFEKPYRAIFLENEFIRIMILPEIGGRIHIGQDKQNGPWNVMRGHFDRSHPMRVCCMSWTSCANALERRPSGAFQGWKSTAI